MAGDARMEDVAVAFKRSADGMSTMAQLTTYANTVVPTSTGCLRPGTAKELLALKKSFTNNLAVYYKNHLPLALESVRNMKSMLGTFELDFEDLLPLLENLNLQVGDYCKEAEDLQHIHEKLGADTLALTTKINSVFSQAEQDILQKIAKKDALQKGAHTTMITGSAAATAACIGGVILCCSLLGPGGMLFAPALAGPALAGGFGAGGAAMAGSVAWCQKLERDAAGLQKALRVTHDAMDAHQRILPVAIQSFAGCMTVSAAFFLGVQMDLKNIKQETDPKISEELLKKLHVKVKMSSRSLKQSLDYYLVHATDFRVKMQFVEAFNDAETVAYADGWLKRNPPPNRRLALGCLGNTN